MIILIDTEKTCDKIQCPLMKIFNKMGTEGMYLNIIKAIMTDPSQHQLFTGLGRCKTKKAEVLGVLWRLS